MAKKKLKDLSKKMQGIDLCMMTTTGKGKTLESRPMSNNGDVSYDGNSYFFTWEDSHLVKDLKKNRAVNLGFQAKGKLFISVSGKAKLVHSRAKMSAHWDSSLDQWFPKGLETDGVVMIHVRAKRIKFWQKDQEGEITIK